MQTEQNGTSVRVFLSPFKTCLATNVPFYCPLQFKPSPHLLPNTLGQRPCLLPLRESSRSPSVFGTLLPHPLCQNRPICIASPLHPLFLYLRENDISPPIAMPGPLASSKPHDIKQPPFIPFIQYFPQSLVLCS